MSNQNRKKALAARIKARRQELQLTQQTVAFRVSKELGRYMSDKRFANLENGKEGARLDVFEIAAIAHALRMSPETLIGGAKDV